MEMARRPLAGDPSEAAASATARLELVNTLGTTKGCGAILLHATATAAINGAANRIRPIRARGFLPTAADDLGAVGLTVVNSSSVFGQTSMYVVPGK